MEKLTMENIVTFYPQQGGYIDFSVKRGYYAGASVYENDQSEIVYVPNGTLIGRVADDYITIEPMESVCDSQEYTENRNACTRVDVYRIKDVNANCPQGWSAVLVEHKLYGDYFCMKVQKIFFTRPFQIALPPQEVAFEWSDDEAGDGGDGDEVAYLQILK